MAHGSEGLHLEHLVLNTVAKVTFLTSCSWYSCGKLVLEFINCLHPYLKNITALSVFESLDVV